MISSFAQETGASVTPWSGEPGVTETVQQIMDRQSLTPERTGWRIGLKPKRIRPDRRNLSQNPASPAISQWPPPKENESSLSPSFSPQTPGTNFLGATLSGTNPTFSFPPDVMGDVGPTQYIVAVNGRIVTFDKTTGVADGVLNADMDVFFTTVRNGSATSDPRIRYDRLTSRWFVIIINVASTNNRVLFAMSNTATITGATVWTYFFFQQNTVSPAGNTNQFADYPTLGVDVNALYIGCNMFTSGGAFSNVTGFVVRKSSLTGGGPIVATAFRNLLDGSFVGPYTPQGVDNFDPAATEGYFIGVDGATYGTLLMRRVSTPGGTPTISGNISLTVPATSAPGNVRHSGNTGGTNGRLSALDDRLFQAVIRNGRLWTAHNILVNNTGAASGTTTRNGARWYEIQNLTTTPTLVQSGTVYTATGTNTVDERNYWIPSVNISGQGHVAMGFSTAGTSEFANAGTVGRLSGDGTGTMQTPVLYTSSSTAYNPGSDPGDPSVGRRWGDYSYTSVDPNDDMTMWTIQQYSNASNSYGVRVVQLIAPPPATPASVSPPSIASGQSSVNVTVTGSSITGSGFFDPGAGFANRIAASMSGGVVVNSVTYLTPTTVTLNLNTVGVSAGTKNVTITNPDGQVRTGNNILTVTASAGTISLTAPNGAESWPVGSAQNILWSSANLTGNITVELSTNGGSSFSTIIANTANDGTEAWAVNAAATANARIRIASIDSVTVADTSAANFSIVMPTLSLTAPDGGDTWPIGSSQTIQWTSTNLTGNLMIELSRDGGVTYPETLYAATANDGSQTWSVTGPADTDARVRISSILVPAVLDTSTNVFSIVQPTITVQAADGGETWYIGTVDTIRWTSQYLTGNVHIDLSTDGGTVFSRLFTDVPNDGSQPWPVTPPETPDARILVSSVSVAGVQDTSNTDFAIVQPVLNVVSANGGELWLVGSSQTIQWNSTNLPGNVRVLLSRDGGNVYPDTLFANTVNDGTEGWTVTGPGTADARVRVVSIDIPALYDVSDTDFVIGAPFVTVSSPDSGETLEIDSTIAIQWSSGFTSGDVLIELSRNGGTTYDTLFVSTPDDGTENWIVTGPSTNDGVIRITNLLNPAALDISNNSFVVGKSASSSMVDGWNMLSVPVTVSDLRKNQVFPSSNSNAFTFTLSGYIPEDTLRYDVGYWLKFPSAQDVTLFGGSREADTLQVVSGWNMIGSISTPVPVDNIIQIPSGIVVSSYYGYSGSSYFSADTINAMRAFWVKTSQAGTLILRKP